MSNENLNLNLNLMEHFVLNWVGTHIDWQATRARIVRWYLSHPSGSIAADVLSVDEHIKQMRKSVRKVGAKAFIAYLKENKLVRYR